MKFEKEHTLPLLAIQATWAAVQHCRGMNGEKMLTIEKLMGDDDQINGQMSKAAMMSEITKLSTVQARWKEEQKKKKEV